MLPEVVQRARQDDPEALFQLAEDEGWSDGLPMVAPTRDRIDAFVAATGRAGDESIGVMPPNWTDITIEKIAANAVLAGCRPEYMPVVVAAIEAAITVPPGMEHSNIGAYLVTTHPLTPAVIVNGPVAKSLGVHGGTGAMGPGWRPNMTIGRAVRLALMNISLVRPGVLDLSTQGSPAKLSWCFTENTDASPWQPFHTDLGYDENDSVVTIPFVDGPRELNDHSSTSAANLMVTLTDGIATMSMNTPYLGGHVVLFLGPDHANLLAREEWTKADVRRYIYEHARVRVGRANLGGMHTMSNAPKWHKDVVDDDARIPIVYDPADIHVVVVGGSGAHSSFGVAAGGNSVILSQAVRTPADAG